MKLLISILGFSFLALFLSYSHDYKYKKKKLDEHQINANTESQSLNDCDDIAYQFNQAESIRFKNISIPKTKDSITINVSDLIQNIRLVRIETTEESVLDNGKFFVGNKYIIHFSDRKIILFNGKGKFIKILSKQGRGPNEFVQIRDYAVNENSGLLYFIDAYKKGKIFVIDLIQGGNFDEISISSGGYIKNLILENDSSFLLAPYYGVNSEYKVFKQTIGGTFIYGIHCAIKKEGFHDNGNDLIFKVKTKVFYRPVENDTIFELIKRRIVPRIIYSLKENQKVEIIGGNSSNMFFLLYTILSKNISGITKTKAEQYMINLDLMKAIKLNIFNDFLNHPQLLYELNFQNNNIMYIKYECSKLQNIIDNILFHNTVVKVSSGQLTELKRLIISSDNPVLLIGEIK